MITQNNSNQIMKWIFNGFNGRFDDISITICSQPILRSWCDVIMLQHAKKGFEFYIKVFFYFTLNEIQLNPQKFIPKLYFGMMAFYTIL